jgi:hypothetical protein
MKVFLAFLLVVFFTATLSPTSDRRPRALPLLFACVLVTAFLSTFKSVG